MVSAPTCLLLAHHCSFNAFDGECVKSATLSHIAWSSWGVDLTYPSDYENVYTYHLTPPLYNVLNHKILLSPVCMSYYRVVCSLVLCIVLCLCTCYIVVCIVSVIYCFVFSDNFHIMHLTIKAILYITTQTCSCL